MLDLGPTTYALSNADEIDSPTLLVYEERVNENLRRMLAQAGGPDRLCPHVKTHKLPQLIVKQWHICPTVNLHSEVVVVKNQQASARWPVAARSRRISL